MRRRSGPLLPGAEDADLASSLKRGLDVLRGLAERGGSVTVGEVAAQFGRPKTSAARLLQTLAAEGMLRPVAGADGAYEADLGCLTLGTAMLNSIPELWQRQPVMQDLARRFDVAVVVATRDGAQGLVLEHAPAAAQPASQVGSVFALEANALGRCLVWSQPANEQADLIDAIRERAGGRSATVLAALYQAFQSLEERRYCTAPVDAASVEIALPVPEIADLPPLALGCSGPAAVLADPARGAELRAQLARLAELIGQPSNPRG